MRRQKRKQRRNKYGKAPVSGWMETGAFCVFQNFPLLWEKPPELTEVPPDLAVSILTRVWVVVM